MFGKGDKIVYPMHGAGVIEGLEEKQIDGKAATYYILSIPIGNLTITVSSQKAEVLGIRSVTTKEEALNILASIKEIPCDIPENWNKRYEYNLEKIKSGEMGQVLEVYICLYLREREKGLSSLEKKLLSTSKQVLLSELIVSQNIEKEAAEDMLKSILKRFQDKIDAST